MERRNIQETPHEEDAGYYPMKPMGKPRQKGHYKEFDTWLIKRIEIPAGKDGICRTFKHESGFMMDVLSKMG